MKKLVYILSIIFCLAACKPTEQVIVHHEYVTHVKDSVVMKDSTVLIPQEVYTNLSWSYENLHLETSLAEADCWVDSLWLRGTIKNKNVASFHHETETIYKDSIVYEEKPVPYPVEVEVEKPLNKKLLWLAIFSSLGFIGALCWIFRKPLMKLISLI